MYVHEKNMLLSPRWLGTAIVTFLFGFCVLGYLAYRSSTEHPPVPQVVRSADGAVLYTGEDIVAGQQLFQKYGLMQYGTLFGHGAYLGPDFTAQYLRLSGEKARAFYTGQGLSAADATEKVRAELRSNNYHAASGALTLSAAQGRAHGEMISYYRDWFGPPATQQGLRRPYLGDQEEVRRITAYFAWGAWASAAQRPGTSHSYTNNWPPDDLAGNRPTPGVLMWSVLSLVALLAGTGLVLFTFGRYEWLGWHAADEYVYGKIDAPERVRLTPSQRTVAWYFLVVAGLFLLQGLLGG